MGYLAQASGGLPSHSTTRMKRERVTQIGRDTQHNFLAKVGVCAIVGTVAFVSKHEIIKK